jgi:hypothetical protein
MTRRNKRFRVAPGLTAFVIANCLSASSFAQSQTMPSQIGVEVSTLGLDRSFTDAGATGVGVRAEFALSPRIEIETRLTWFPADVLQEFQAQGGQTLQVAAGIRGKLWKSRRASVYGLLLPGLIHVTDAIVAETLRSPTSGAATHFTLDTGLGIEWYAGARWTARVEASSPLYAVPGTDVGQILASNGQTIGVVLSGRFVKSWQVSSAIGYRLGSARPSEPEEPVAGRWEVGGEFVHTTAIDALQRNPQLYHIPSLGLFLSYRLMPAVYLDGAVNASLQQLSELTPFDEGYMLQALGGAKIGTRRDGFGIFAKVRAGTNSYSKAFASAESGMVTTRRFNATAIDIGSVVERYIGRRWLIRVDGGDVISGFHDAQTLIDGSPVVYRAPSRTHSIQLLCGIGLIF